ncbi:MAG: EVE domain-containing protein [Candidatus Acidiferrales bacterium]
MQQFWLFQATPDEYKLVEKVPAHLAKGDFWLAKQHRDKLRAGDKVILWQSGKEAGIYAFGSVAGKPYMKQNKWRVDIQYNPLLRQPVFKRDLKKHPLLSNLSVLKMPRGTTFPVRETEWQALDELISKDTISIFTPYKQEENRFTNGLVALLQLSSRCGGPLPAASFLRDLIALEPRGEIGSFHVLRGYDGHADAELCGPDSCIRFETKIESGALHEDQVKRHLESLEHAPQPRRVLVLLTPDDSSSSYVKGFLSSKCIKSFCSKDKGHIVTHLEWKQVHDYLELSVASRRVTAFSRLVSQFLNQIHDRIFEQDFAGIIEKIAFGDDSEVYAETNDEHTGYLDDDLKDWKRWNTPRRHDKLDGKGRKLLLYDPVRKAITVEFEIAKVEPKKWRGKFSCRNSIAPKTAEIYSQPIPLTHIEKIPGFRNFARGRAGAWNVTREEYRLLREV